MNEIILYFKEGCPKCRVLKKKLYDLQIECRECQDIKKMKDLELNILPVLYVDGKKLQYLEAIEWINSYIIEENN